MKRLSLGSARESTGGSSPKKDPDTVTETSQLKRYGNTFPGPSKKIDKGKTISVGTDRDFDSDKIFTTQKKVVKDMTTLDGKITIANQM